MARFLNHLQGRRIPLFGDVELVADVALIETKQNPEPLLYRLIRARNGRHVDWTFVKSRIEQLANAITLQFNDGNGYDRKGMCDNDSDDIRFINQGNKNSTDTLTPESARSELLWTHPLTGVTSLHVACCWHPPPSVVLAYVRACPDVVWVTSHNGSTPLHAACGNGACTEVVRAILNAAEDSSRQPPLTSSTSFSRLGTSNNSPTSFIPSPTSHRDKKLKSEPTAAASATTTMSMKTTLALLQTNDRKWTALHYACHGNGSEATYDVLRLLLEAAPSASIMIDHELTELGRTPLDILCSNYELLARRYVQRAEEEAFRHRIMSTSEESEMTATSFAMAEGGNGANQTNRDGDHSGLLNRGVTSDADDNDDDNDDDDIYGDSNLPWREHVPNEPLRHFWSKARLLLRVASLVVATPTAPACSSDCTYSVSSTSSLSPLSSKTTTLERNSSENEETAMETVTMAASSSTTMATNCSRRRRARDLPTIKSRTTTTTTTTTTTAASTLATRTTKTVPSVPVVHAALSLPPPCPCPPTLLRLALSSFPDQFAVKDGNGDLPLHVACRNLGTSLRALMRPRSYGLMGTRVEGGEGRVAGGGGEEEEREGRRYLQRSYLPESGGMGGISALDVLLRDNPDAASVASHRDGLLPFQIAARGEAEDSSRHSYRMSSLCPYSCDGGAATHSPSCFDITTNGGRGERTEIINHPAAGCCALVAPPSISADERKRRTWAVRKVLYAHPAAATASLCPTVQSKDAALTMEERGSLESSLFSEDKTEMLYPRILRLLSDPDVADRLGLPTDGPVYPDVGRRFLGRNGRGTLRLGELAGDDGRRGQGREERAPLRRDSGVTDGIIGRTGGAGGQDGGGGASLLGNVFAVLQGKPEMMLEGALVRFG